MAFANRFHFCFNSVHGVEYNIYILKDGYSGDCDHRRIGRAPILRKQKNGPICGTSLDLYAECAPGHDGEFAELYTSDPKKFRVDVYRAGSLIWTGFVSTELYSEPSIAPPYDVQITATDGLGELKQIDFVPASLVTLSEHIRTALSYTGANKTIYVASSLIMQGESVVDTFGMSINLDYLNGKNYYDVLTSLLNTLHATITLYGDCWLITRETDLENLLSGGSLSVVSIAPNGSRSTATLSGVVKSVGAMGSADLWPNGNLSTAIDPARKEVVVEAPWHNVPVGIEMQNWETEGDVYGNYTLGRTGETGVIKKEITVDRLDCDIDIILNLGALRDQARPYGVHEGIIRVYLEYENSHLSDPIEGTASGWGAREPQYTEYNISNLTPKDFTFSFPSGGFDDPGTLRIVVQGISVNVNACSIKICPDNAGYRDTIKIDNGARGKDNAVEVTGSRALEDNIIKKEFYVGIWLYGGDIVLKFADSRFSNGDFLSITALSYATSAALARIKTEGHLDVASSISKLPLLITFQGETQWIDTYEWDLKAEDASIVALSLPSNTLDVEAETVTPLPEGYSSSSSGGGSGSGSAASAVPQQKTYFEEDGDGNVKLKDEYGGLWTKGFLTAGGVGQSSGGGGGDVDLPRVWKSLQNQDTINTYNDYKFSTAHLPTLGAGLAYTDNQGSGASLATTLGIASGYKLPTTEEWANVSDNLNSLQALQAQVDSLSTRNNFDELTASAIFVDILAASDIYGALHGNADTATNATNAEFATKDASGNTITSYYAKASDLTSVSGRVATLEARQNWDEIFGIDDNGNVYIKKNGNASRGLWTYGFLTAGGVGQSSGGGSGVDLPRVWNSLQNQDTVNTYNAYKISTAHLPNLGTGLAYTDNQGSGAGLATTLSIASGYKLPTTTEWSGIDSSFTIISSALQSLQAQIDSVATRDNFDELTATAFFADVIAASDIYGALHGNADTATSATTDASGNTFTTYYAKASDLSSISSRVSTLEARQNWDDIFGIDSNGNVYVKKNGTTARGFWTYGFVTAGGVGQSSGGSGDVDLPRVWNSLQNQDTINTYNAYKISTAHLPTLGSGLAYTDNQGSGASLATTLGIASGYKLPTTEEWANVADNLNSLQALQAQVDSLSTRENFDELTASALFADVLAASDGYFGAIYGPLHGNADTATSATSAGSSTTASYLVSSSYGEGSGKNPIYFSGGRPVASSSSEGSASLPVYLSGGYLTACTASSLFSSLSSTAATNLSVTVAGQNRTATLYATYDTASENIASNFSTVGTALKSLQSQIDSVATRNAFDELLAAVIAADTVAATSIYGALHGNADTATYATSASYATYDSASENIASNFTTVGTALKSLQAQIDSVAMNRAFDELTVTAGYFDMLSVGANLNVAGTIYSIKGIYSSGYVTAGAVGSSSDRRLKNDVEAISAKRASEVIMALRPCEWVWNEKHSTLEGRRSAGLIAQEVSDILPDMVIETNGELSLLHNVLHGYQISMLQDHETRIEELEKEVAALRKENTELKSRITA